MKEQVKLKKDNEARIAIRLDKDFLKECDLRQKRSCLHTRTAYIEAALKLYNQYIDGECPLEFLAPAFSSMFDASIKSFEDHISRNIFKIAVELAKVLNVLAAVHDIDDNTLKELQIKCVDEVRKINGILDFNDAVKYQKS